MLVAFFIVFLLFYLWHKTKFYELIEHQKIPLKKARPSWSRTETFIFITLLLTLTQIILGTQTREEVNLVETTMTHLSRNEWADHLGLFFTIHRSFSIAVLISHIGLFLYLRKNIFKGPSLFNKALLYTVFLETFSGIGMAYFGIPPFLQPIHLLLASFMVGVLFYLFLSTPYHHLSTKSETH